MNEGHVWIQPSKFGLLCFVHCVTVMYVRHMVPLLVLSVCSLERERLVDTIDNVKAVQKTTTTTTHQINSLFIFDKLFEACFE